MVAYPGRRPVKVLFVVGAAQCETQGLMRFPVAQSNRGEHVGRLRRSAAARGPRRDRNAVQVQREQQGLPLDTLEAEVQVEINPPLGAAVQADIALASLIDVALKPLSQRADTLGVFIHHLSAEPDRFAEAYDARHVLRAGADSALLPSAPCPRDELDPLADVERADPFRSVNLVRRRAGEIGTDFANRQRQLAERLYRIRVEQRPGLMRGLRQLPNGLNGADFVVDVHHADQRGRLLQRLAQLGRIDNAIAPDLEEGYLESSLMKMFRRVKNGGMLDRADDQVVAAFLLRRFHDAEQRQIVRLRAPGGEVQFLGIYAEQSGNLAARFIEQQLGLVRLGVPAGGIAPTLDHRAVHHVRDARIDRGSRTVIQIDKPLAAGAAHFLLRLL